MDREKRREIEEKYRGQVPPPYSLAGVRDHYEPHPFTVGPKHVVEAANKYGGRLGEEVCRKVGCAAPGCQLSYDAHQTTTILFVNMPEKLGLYVPQDLNDWLVKVKDQAEVDGIGGFGFVEPGKSIGSDL